MIWRVGLVFFFSLSTAKGDVVNPYPDEVSKYSYCYFKITGQPVPLFSVVQAHVKAGKIKALEACSQLLESAKLSLTTFQPVSGVTTETKAILKNFYNFHRQWFSGQNVEDITEASDETGPITRNIYDSTEPALALTYALLSPGFPFKQVLNGQQGYRALRENDPALTKRMGWTSQNASRWRYAADAQMDKGLVLFRKTHLDSVPKNFISDGSTSIVSQFPLIATGELMGIKQNLFLAQVPNVELFPLGSSWPGDFEKNLNNQYDAFKGYGGGILGMPIYVMMNFGHPRGLKMNGTTKVPRRWAEATLKTFLCANLPSLREADVQAFVKTSSPTSFRRSASCVSCHATLDQMAYGLRHIIMTGSDFAQLDRSLYPQAPAAYPTYLASSYQSTMASTAGWPDDERSSNLNNFNLQTPSGRLFYRSFSGELVDFPFSNLDDLGARLTQSSDFYLCTARRYFEFLTNISVPLYDKYDRRNSDQTRQYSVREKKLNEHLIQLADHLKSSQSLLALVQDIILNSPYFLNQNYGIETDGDTK